MMSTSTQRLEYSEWIVDDDPLTCNTTPFVLVGLPASFGGADGIWDGRFHATTKEAWEVVAHVFVTNGYEMTDGNKSGSFNCRPINNNPNNESSLHAHGIALDAAPEVPLAAREQLLAVKTHSGAQVFRVFGYDDHGHNHIEINCSKADLVSGINWATVPGGGDEMDYVALLSPMTAEWWTVVLEGDYPDPREDWPQGNPVYWSIPANVVAELSANPAVGPKIFRGALYQGVLAGGGDSFNHDGLAKKVHGHDKYVQKGKAVKVVDA